MTENCYTVTIGAAAAETISRALHPVLEDTGHGFPGLSSRRLEAFLMVVRGFSEAAAIDGQRVILSVRLESPPVRDAD